MVVLVVPMVVQPVLSEDSGGLFVNLTTRDTWRAGMGLKFAHNVLKEGHDVTVFLNVEAVTLAARELPQDTFGMLDKTPQQLLEDILKDGGRVIVCPMCMKRVGITQDDLMDGVTVGKPSVTVPALLKPGVKVMSY
jgi:predicted peroxiredoxin